MNNSSKLKEMYKRIDLLKSQRSLAWNDWHVLNNKEQLSKEESKEKSSLSTLISSLNYEIRGLQLKFNDQVQLVVAEIVNS